MSCEESNNLEWPFPCVPKEDLWKLQRHHDSKTNVLIIKKLGDPDVTNKLLLIAKYLIHKDPGYSVYVEPSVYEQESARLPSRSFTWQLCPADVGPMLSATIDLVICLGGDGTLLHINSLFANNSVPPCLCFNLGSLGFLTPFSWDPTTFSHILDKVTDGEFFHVRRKRLHCYLRSAPTDSQAPQISFLGIALNEVTIDRGTSPYLTNLQICCDGLPITSIQADGLIVATSTGSTAYSLSAGGTMMHPSVPAILLTPICPHSLTSRPIALPDSVVLQIQVDPEARASAWTHLDGRHRFELKVGDQLILQISPFPLTCVTPTGYISDWFLSLANCLHWNTRSHQSPLIDRSRSPPHSNASL